VSLQALFYSPNLVWLVISAAMYIAVPYNLEADGGPKDGWAASWMLPRFYLNCGVTMAYVGYWYLSLYHLSFSELKFKPQNSPGFGRMVHNMWYTFLGAVQWSAWEVIFMRLWATGTLPYVKDATTLTDPVLLAKMLFWVASIPVFREFHFYWAHRMLHFRVLCVASLLCRALPGARCRGLYRERLRAAAGTASSTACTTETSTRSRSAASACTRCTSGPTSALQIARSAHAKALQLMAYLSAM
jgi:hypothetical protein